jgi:voltage-gated potassium channel
MTTVGYGDISPKTPEGKAITVCVMLVGIGFATLLIAAIAERFVRPPVHDPELTEEDLLAQVKEISVRLQHLQRVIEHRSGS